MDDKQYQPLDSINNPDVYPENYLDQISTGVSQKKPLLSNKLMIFIVILLGLFIIFGALALFATPGNQKSNELKTLSTRLVTLQRVTDKASKQLKSSQLRSTNSNLSIFLTNTNPNIQAPLASAGIDIKAGGKKAPIDQNSLALEAKLEDASLNAIYDRTYAREIDFQLSTAQVEMQNIYKTTKNKDLKKFLQDTATNLEPIKQQFNEYLTAP